MKRQVLARKLSVFILTASLFIHFIHGVGYAELAFVEGQTTTREVAENAPAGTNVGFPLRSILDDDRWVGLFYYELSGPDAEAFELDIVPRKFERTQLKTKFPLDYEGKSSYEVTVTVFATKTTDTGTITVTINVTDVNEMPVFSESIVETNYFIRRLVPENIVPGIDIGGPVSAIDPDGSEVALTYSLSGVNADMFEIDTVTGQLRTKMPLDYEAFDSEPRAYFVEVRVSDGTLSAETQVWVYVQPVSEFAPMFTDGETTTREIREEAEVGMNVGEPVSATDMDVGETLEYSITDAEAFEIDSSTGQLRTKAPLYYQTKPTHTVKVLVSDGSQTDSIIVTIQILTDVVEVPDPTLAAFIRVRLGLSANADITKGAISRLTVLNANRSFDIGVFEICNLTGLEHAKNLTTLLLNSNSVGDLTPLKDLKKLATLEIYGNYVVSLTPLKGLMNLKKLQLGYNRIHDLTPLAGLKNLTELLLRSNNRIRDLTALADLKNLTTLNLSENLIKDLTPLAELTNLTTLHLAYNFPLTDVSPLAGLVNLETLELVGCPIQDFSPLADLTASIDVLGGSAPAVNGDRIDSILDLAMLKTLDREALQARLQRLSSENDGSLKYRRAIAMLESVLASMRPEKTMLLANYPNPFNPETWIPYHLSKATHVQISIYDAYGTVIRHLELGHQSVGYYTSRNQAAYWDGKNDFGERVASGIYFYQLQADTISPVRKMLILK